MAHPRHLNQQRSESIEAVREMLSAMGSDAVIPQQDHADIGLSHDLQQQKQIEALAEAVLALYDQANRRARSVAKQTAAKDEAHED